MNNRILKDSETFLYVQKFVFDGVAKHIWSCQIIGIMEAWNIGESVIPLFHYSNFKVY